MKTLKTIEASSKLCGLMDEVVATHEPILILGERGIVVLIAEQDWNAINETLFLLSIPGMRESIREQMDCGLDDTLTKLDW